MPFLRFVIWTSASVAFGIFLSSAQFGGKTPLKHLQQAWSENGLAPVKGLFADAKSAATQATKPAEHYTSEDREALNKIVAKRAGTK